MYSGLLNLFKLKLKLNFKADILIADIYILAENLQ